MLIADANGPAVFVEPTEVPTPTPEAVEEILVDEAMETTTSAEIQATPMPDATPVDVSSPSWIALLLVVIALIGVQVFKSKKDGKKKI